MLLVVALIGATVVVWNVTDTNYNVEETVHIGDDVAEANGQNHLAGENDPEKDVGVHHTVVSEVVRKD